jgi:beta-lactamase class A
MSLTVSQGRSKTRLRIVLPSVFLSILAVLVWLDYRLHAGTSLAEESHFQEAQTFSFNTIREKGYDLINPLILAETNISENSLSNLKAKLQTEITRSVSSGDIVTSTIYVKRFSDEGCLKINIDQEYSPGSLMKVVILMAFLKEEETTPGTLNRSLFLKTRSTIEATTHFAEEQIQVGRTYTIRELLTHMIVDSDNDATSLLYTVFPMDKYHKLFADLNIPEPENVRGFTIKTTDFARFLNVLYNSSYLSKPLSQFALSLLVQSKFNLGITRDLKDVKAAHKYGESGTNDMPELHEAAIVYLKDHPYMVIINTAGKDFKRMSETISRLSDIIYYDFKGSAVAGNS